MKAASLFTGIGAPEYATRALPYKWIWGAEIDKSANEIMRRNFPDHVNLGDVKNENFISSAAAAGKPDIIVFGSPCQSFSVAGEGLGLDDPRGDLTLRALRIVDGIRPRWFLWENVPGVLSNGFGSILKEIKKCGYNGAWRILDAQFFGVPQRRRRLFFLGYCGSGRAAAQVLFDGESIAGDSLSCAQKGETSTRAIFERGQDGAIKKKANVGAILTQGKTDKGGAAMIYEYHGQDSRIKETQNITPTLARKMGTGGGNVPIVQQNETLRWLTPDEAEACQGFPKGYTDCVSQSARYRTIGNSMAVPVIEWILSRIHQEATA